MNNEVSVDFNRHIAELYRLSFSSFFTYADGNSPCIYEDRIKNVKAELF